MKKIITTEKAPAPIGPYNQAVMLGNMLYTSGQIAIDPKSGKLITDTIEAETTLVMQNLKAILEAANMSFKNVIKSSIFVSNSTPCFFENRSPKWSHLEKKSTKNLQKSSFFSGKKCFALKSLLFVVNEF